MFLRRRFEDSHIEEFVSFLSSSVSYASSFAVPISFIMCYRTNRQLSTTTMSRHPCFKVLWPSGVIL